MLQFLLNMVLKRCGFFACRGYPFRCLTPFGNADLIGLNKINRLFFTEPDTLRITVTKIALKDLSVGRVKYHGPERTCAHTGTASNADIIINSDTF